MFNLVGVDPSHINHRSHVLFDLLVIHLVWDLPGSFPQLLKQNLIQIGRQPQICRNSAPLAHILDNLLLLRTGTSVYWIEHAMALVDVDGQQVLSKHRDTVNFDQLCELHFTHVHKVVDNGDSFYDLTVVFQEHCELRYQCLDAIAV